MRPTLQIVSLIAVLSLWGIGSHVQAQPTGAKELILYAKTVEDNPINGGNILTAEPPGGPLLTADATKNNTFVSDPPLAARIRIKGTVQFKMWLRGSASASGLLKVSLHEVGPEGGVLELISMEATIALRNRVQLYQYSTVMDGAIRSGSRIGLAILLTGLPSGISAELYWNDPNAPTQVSLPVIEGTLYKVEVQAVDAEDRPLGGAALTVMRGSVRAWHGTTNATGWATMLLESSDVVGSYSIILEWLNVTVAEVEALDVAGDMRLKLRGEVYSTTVMLKDHFGMPIAGADARLLMGRSTVATTRTDAEGAASFGQVPKGAYTLSVTYRLTTLHYPITIDSPELTTITVFVPFHTYHFIAAGLVVGALAARAVVRRLRHRPRELPFTHLDELTGGGIPASSTVMIIGGPASGKTVLLEQLAHRSVLEGRPTIFVTNTSFPSEVRARLSQLAPSKPGTPSPTFIDAYSCVSGRPSSEPYHVSSLTDLTALGTRISTCLEGLEGGASAPDVYLDSLTPLLTMLKADYVAAFVHATGAKVKARGGRFMFTITEGAEEPRGIAMLEATSDCVIQLEAKEVHGEMRRRLRVKKMRGRHMERWVEFTIRSGTGISFRDSMGPPR